MCINKIEILQETPFLQDTALNRKPGTFHQCNILKSSYMKFNPIWSL